MTNSTKISIREFHETDTKAVQQIIYRTIDTSYSPLYPPRAIEFFKEFHSHSKIMERHQNGKIFVVEKEGHIIGTGSFVNGEILGVFVNPSFQQQGYGKVLMRQLEKEAELNGYSEVSLSISLPSRKFYEDLDYTNIEECSIDVGNGESLDYWEAKKFLKK